MRDRIRDESEISWMKVHNEKETGTKKKRQNNVSKINERKCV